MSTEHEVRTVASNESWYQRRAKSAAKKDVLTRSECVGEVVGIAVTFAITAFFLYHQVASTGFFTSKFGSIEAFLFYSALLFGAVTAAARALTGRRNAIRPMDAIGGVLWIVANFWLYTVFPFNFAHLADALPGFLQFALSWISNDIGRILLLLGGLGGAIAATDAALMYVFVRREFEKSAEVRGQELTSTA